ncbi:hypothetical protein FKP32DRAFT_736067 [Trametes sanguinea]|nr:hypothetical protein FKP32DRAFT_736067 [Trametes sanguinea]
MQEILFPQKVGLGRRLLRDCVGLPENGERKERGCRAAYTAVHWCCRSQCVISCEEAEESIRGRQERDAEHHVTGTRAPSLGPLLRRSLYAPWHSDAVSPVSVPVSPLPRHCHPGRLARRPSRRAHLLSRPRRAPLRTNLAFPRLPPPRQSPALLRTRVSRLPCNNASTAACWASLLPALSLPRRGRLSARPSSQEPLSYHDI